jgi:hypothetical protein
LAQPLSTKNLRILILTISIDRINGMYWTNTSFIDSLVFSLLIGALSRHVEAGEQPT